MLRSARNCRFLTVPIAVVIGVAILVFPIAGGGGGGSGSFVLAAHAQSNVQEKTIKDGEKIIKDVKSLIERLRHGDLPEGIAKTNGRIESTEVDVSSKYAGRLQSVMVDEGDNVKVGQVIARIDSPEYQAQLRTAQANVLVAPGQPPAVLVDELDQAAEVSGVRIISRKYAGFTRGCDGLERISRDPLSAARSVEKRFLCGPMPSSVEPQMVSG